MSALEFGIVDGGTTFDYARLEQTAQEIEAAGARFLGFGESLTAGGDPYLCLAAAGRMTKKLQLGTAVIKPGSRHPALLARTLLTLNSFTGGRAFLGIGTGLFLSSGRSRLQAFEDYCLAVKGLIAGETVTYEGETLQLKAAGAPAQIPLWVAAEGPRTLELAGRIADAVMVENGAMPSVVDYVRRHVAIGAKAAGRSIDDIEIWYMVRMRVDESVDAAFGAPGIAAYGASFVSEAWRVVRPGEGDPVEQLRRKKGIIISADIAKRLEAFSNEAVPEFFSPLNIDLLDKHGLREWITQTYFAFGPRDDVVARVQALADAGATKFMVPNFVPRSVKDVADVISRVTQR